MTVNVPRLGKHRTQSRCVAARLKISPLTLSVKAVARMAKNQSYETSYGSHVSESGVYLNRPTNVDSDEVVRCSGAE